MINRKSFTFLQFVIQISSQIILNLDVSTNDLNKSVPAKGNNNISINKTKSKPNESKSKNQKKGAKSNIISNFTRDGSWLPLPEHNQYPKCGEKLNTHNFMGVNIKNTLFCVEADKSDSLNISCKKCKWWAKLSKCQKESCHTNNTKCYESYCSLKTWGKFAVVTFIILVVTMLMVGCYICCFKNKPDHPEQPEEKRPQIKSNPFGELEMMTSEENRLKSNPYS